MSAAALPETPLNPRGELGTRFAGLGLRDYRSAARYVGDLPYGRNADRADYRLVLREGRGTCSTKHALLAALAREIGLGVELRVGIYLMDGENTPAIGDVLGRHKLSRLPEAHCYLAYRGRRVDLTGAGGVPPARFLREEAIDPEQIGAYKVGVHRAFMERWSGENGLDFEEVWKTREECIAALSGVGRDPNGGQDGWT